MEAVIMVRRARLAVSLLFAAVVICSCHSFVKKPLRWFNEKDLSLQNENGIFVVNGQPFSGIVYAIRNSSNDTIAVAAFVDGMEDGEWRKYFGNGQLSERRFYSNGKKSGVYEAWWPNGKQRLLYHFENGEYEGSCKDWNENGVLTGDMHYHEGHESGLQTQYYDNGVVKANYVMKEGSRYGLMGRKNCVNVTDSLTEK